MKLMDLSTQIANSHECSRNRTLLHFSTTTVPNFCSSDRYTLNVMWHKCDGIPLVQVPCGQPYQCSYMGAPPIHFSCAFAHLLQRWFAVSLHANLCNKKKHFFKCKCLKHFFFCRLAKSSAKEFLHSTKTCKGRNTEVATTLFFYWKWWLLGCHAFALFWVTDDEQGLQLFLANCRNV